MDPTLTSLAVHLLTRKGFIQWLTTILPAKSLLSALHLHGTKFQESQDTPKLCTMLNRLLNLHEFCLSMCPFSAGTVAAFAEALEQNATLTSLTIGPSLSPISLKSVLQDLTLFLYSKNLKSLTLAGRIAVFELYLFFFFTHPYVGFDVDQAYQACSLVPLAGALASNRTLRQFTLQLTPLPDPLVLQLADGLRSKTCLDFASCTLSSAEFTRADNSKLKDIALEDLQATLPAMEVLLSALLARKSQLRMLSLARCRPHTIPFQYHLHPSDRRLMLEFIAPSGFCRSFCRRSRYYTWTSATAASRTRRRSTSGRR